MAARAHLEAMNDNDAHNDCVVSRQIYIANRGSVRHVHDQCPQLARSQVFERFACQACASYVSPYRYDANTTTQDLNAYLGQLEDLSGEDRFTEPPEAIPDVAE